MQKKKRNLVSLTFEHSRSFSYSMKSSTISKNNSIRPLESRALSIVAYLKRKKTKKKRGIELRVNLPHPVASIVHRPN